MGTYDSDKESSDDLPSQTVSKVSYCFCIRVWCLLMSVLQDETDKESSEDLPSLDLSMVCYCFCICACCLFDACFAG